MNSTKPYLLRSIYEWCIDSDFTPFITVVANPDLGIPMESEKDGEIVFNISYTAVKNLVIDNDTISFEARFNGVSKKLELPMDMVKGIFAKEVNQGIAFQEELKSVDIKNRTTKDTEASNTPNKPTKKKRKPQLRIVK
ncbi:MAG: ClpXP protease specificity-enhancing factor [Nitrosomonas sp.]|nr:ClpXP protease specificity-enhancing factor [Nitrosomonas sp.]